VGRVRPRHEQCGRPLNAGVRQHEMTTPKIDLDRVYQRIGEFVVTFQWIEDMFRQIGWFILDPSRRDWPPKQLRTETSADLADKVDGLFAEAIMKCRLSDSEERRADFHSLVARFHAIRKLRNRHLHSAYIELKAGGEVQALLRTNPKFDIDPETNEMLIDQVILGPESFDQEMKEMAEVGFHLGMHYKQLIHRLPTNVRKRAV
jgi:hypothetical protein